MTTETTTITMHHASVSWDADRDDLRAHTVRLAEQSVAASSAPEFGGNGTKADPEELFVASLSACHMLWFLDCSRRKRLRVTAYEDEAEGTMDGTRFTRVVLRPRVTFREHPGRKVVDQLHHRAHELCFVANTVNCPVEVEMRAGGGREAEQPGD
jgi:organic hydroperoxide reductase OsmC/OhrA